MAYTKYADLSADQQEMIDRTRFRLGDTDEASSWFDNGNDDYALLLAYVVGDINLTPPVLTSYAVTGAPAVWSPVMELGLTVEAIRTRMSKWTETPGLSGFVGPYANFEQFMQRWSTRLAEAQTAYAAAKKSLKVLYHIPSGGVGSVDRWGYFGRSASEVPLLRGMSSWYWSR